MSTPRSSPAPACASASESGVGGHRSAVSAPQDWTTRANAFSLRLHQKSAYCGDREERYDASDHGGRASGRPHAHRSGACVQRGCAYTVPFSLLGAVQNQSRDWVIDKMTLGITFDSDVERTRKLIKQIGQQLAQDPNLRP